MTIVSLQPHPLPLQQGATGTLTATVTAAGNTSTASATVQVTPPPPVVTSITQAALTLPKGTPGTLRVTVSRAPNSATAVTLSTSNTAIASVPPTVNIAAGALFAEFPVSANAPGQATLTATLNGGSASAAITVMPPEVTTLTLSPQAPTATVGSAVPFSATATLTDGSTQNLTQQVTWLSSDNSTASIAPTGIATAQASGQSLISAAYTYLAVQSGQSVTVSASTPLTVRTPVALELSSQTTALAPGQSTSVTVSTADPAPVGGLVVTLTQSGSGTGSFPATLTLAEGQSSAPFDFTAGSAGSVSLAATAPGRQPGLLTLSIAPALTLTAIDPITGTPGSTIALTGTGFIPNPAGNQVTFAGNAPAQVLTATATQLTVTVPDTAQTGPVTVSNANGTVSSAPINFTVPASAPAGLYFIHPDHLNTPRLITDQAGTVVWRWENNDPFGNNVPNENPNGAGNFTCNLRLPGQYFDRETNLHYNYFRDFDPTIGRYVESDPIGLRGGINTYAYVNSNPLNLIDERGLETTIITTYDYGVGTHSAMYINTPGQKPFLYDPAGSYDPKGDPRGTGGFFEGRFANLNDYVKYQESTGSTVELTKIPTTPSQETAIKDRAIDIGDPRGFSCASSVSAALGGVCGIPGSRFPGNLRKQAKEAQCIPSKR